PQAMAHGREIEISRRALLGDPQRRFRLAEAIRMTSVLMAWSMENAIETADSMRAKSFDAGRRRAYGRIRWSGRDIPALASIIIFTTIAAAGGAAGGSAFLYYPYLTIPARAWEGGAVAIWHLGCAALFSIPFLTDGIFSLSDRIRDARRQAAPIDPLVTAMFPQMKRGGQ
ncbi:MAG: hypothetical protein GX819_00955, partial [Clostridiaceae bacterium]|nr:hypothetical protein [Clostridiaceae bacterium]